MIRFFLLVLFVFYFSTSVSAEYCSDDRWRKAQHKQDDFSQNWKSCYANYNIQLDNFRNLQLLNRQYSAKEMEMYCRDNPEDCRKMFEKNAVAVQTVADFTKFDIERTEKLIKEGEILIDEWHVLSGACYERSSDNLKRGKENAAKVRTDLEKVRQFLFKFKMIYFLCQQEIPLLQHIENVLKKIKTEGKDASSTEKQ